MRNESMIVPRYLVRRAGRRVLFAALAGMAGAGLTACATAPRESPPSYANWRGAMGETVDRVRFNHLIDWQPLDREWVLLEFSDGRLFALELRDPCITDTREARSLALDTAMANTLHRSDRVEIGRYRCLIETIRPLKSQKGRSRGAAAVSRSG